MHLNYWHHKRQHFCLRTVSHMCLGTQCFVSGNVRYNPTLPGNPKIYGAVLKQQRRHGSVPVDIGVWRWFVASKANGVAVWPAGRWAEGRFYHRYNPASDHNYKFAGFILFQPSVRCPSSVNYHITRWRRIAPRPGWFTSLGTWCPYFQCHQRGKLFAIETRNQSSKPSSNFIGTTRCKFGIHGMDFFIFEINASDYAPDLRRVNGPQRPQIHPLSIVGRFPD